MTHNSLKTFVKGIFKTGNLNVNNYVARVVNYSSNIDHETESSSNGDFLIQTRFDVGSESAEL